jgi:hypothetical protein
MARPKKQIDQKTFEGLCGIQCTQSEICDFFDITDKTLNSWCRRTYGESFSEVFDKKRSKGKISLRRAGFELAKKNPAVHIFYCKNFLGMTDKQDVTTTIDAKDNFIEALTASASTDWNDYGGDV